MRYLRKNTAVIVSVGPFFDATDGVTIETGLTITNERITLVVDGDAGSAPTLVLDNITGATSSTDNDLNYITNNDAGLMQLELSAANTNYSGRAFLTITDAANHVPVFHEFTILPEAVYDSLILGTDLLGVDAQEISSDATAADNLETAADGGSYNLGGGGVVAASVTASVTAGTVSDKTGYALTGDYDAAKTAATQTSVDDLPTNAELATALGTADDAVLAAVADVPTVAEFEARTLPAADYVVVTDTIAGATLVGSVDGDTKQTANVADLITTVGAAGAGLTALATQASVNTVDGIVDNILVDTTAIKAKTELIPAAPAAVGDIPSAGTIADAVVDETLNTGHDVANSLGKIIFDNVNAPIATVDTVVDAIKEKTDNLPTDPADQSLVESAITSATSTLATSSELATVAGYIDTEVAAILADTNEIQTDLADGGRIDLLVDGIKAKTDVIPADPATETNVNANETKIDLVLVDTGAIKAKTDNLPSDPADQSAVEAAITAATAPLATAADLATTDGKVDDILEDTGTTIPAILATLSGEGAGSTPNEITLSDGTNPIADADVWVTTDSAGTNIIAGTLQTNSLGKVTFMLDTDVTYYLWVQKDGWNFSNPTTIVGA
jgi:hypothetical protein